MAMRACLLIAHSFSPPHSFTFSIAKILRKNGFEAIIIGVGNRKLPQEDILDNGIRLLRARNDGLYFSPFVSILNPFTLASLLRKALRERADIYWCHGYAMLPIMFVFKLLGKRVIYDVGDDDPSNLSYVIRNSFHLRPIAAFVERGFRFMEHIAIRRVDYVVTLTESLKRDRVNFARRIKAIYYCIDPVFSPNSTDDNLIQRFKDFNVIVYSGTISPNKAANEILDAFLLVKEQIPNALLLMVGASSSESNEGEFEESLKKVPDVVVTGWLPYIEMPKYICQGKVSLAIVKPFNYSYKISIPFKLLEQMACGLPVIASKGLPEVERIVHLADCGILVDPNAPRQIGDAVIELLCNERLRSTMGRNARTYIEQHHNLRIMEKDFMEVCSSVLLQG
ncbi:MAG: glycosyltransferase family 4 protein [Dehalococcoidia bacterium]|nr:glycosyltransferase family 4 protein [Dehalococcoidia bacterium]